VLEAADRRRAQAMRIRAHPADARAGEPVDLLITDMVMPAMGGKETCEPHARANFPDIRIIFMSGYPSAPDELLPGTR